MFLFKCGLCVRIYSLNYFVPAKPLIPLNILRYYGDYPDSLRSGSNSDKESRLEDRDKLRFILQ